jgi:hypothetical protein
LQHEIDAELPKGSSRQQVQVWLARHQFESWELSDSSGRKCGIGTTIQNSSWLESALIDVEFHFDDRGQLEMVYVDRIYY